MKKGLIITAGILVSLGFVIIFGAFAAAGFDIDKLSGVKFEKNSYVFDEPISSLMLELDTADVVFKPSEDGKCRVVCFENEKEKYAVKSGVGILGMTYNTDREWYDFLLFSFRSPSVTVYLSEGYYSYLNIENRTGDITVPEGFEFNEAIVKTSTGDVSFGASVKEILNIETLTGDVALRNTKNAKLIGVSVNTGDVRIDSVSCKFSLLVSAGTGDAEISNAECGEFGFKASTGDLTLKKTVSSGKLSIETTTGDVCLDNCDAQYIKVKTSTGDVEGTLRSPKIFLTNTSTGDVDVPKSTEGGICEIKTSTGDIKLRISGK